GHEIGGQPELRRGFRLVCEALCFLVRLREYVRGQRLEPALELERFAELANTADRALVGGSVAARARLADTVDQAAVARAVLRGDLGRRAAGRLPPDAARFEYRDLAPLGEQQAGGGEADDAAAHDGDVGLEIAVQGRPGTGVALGQPERL